MFMVPEAPSCALASSSVHRSQQYVAHAFDVSAVVVLLFVEQYTQHDMPYHELFAYSIAALFLLRFFSSSASCFMYSSF